MNMIEWREKIYDSYRNQTGDYRDIPTIAAEFLAGFAEPFAALASSEQRNRELTRQVEQLQAQLSSVRKLAADWRLVDELIRQYQAADKIENAISRAALTAPPSSAPTDPGRADTGREET